MNTCIDIKNFRIFDKEGTTIDFCPITILTGCNNAGKSSIVKALCLLKDFCQQMEQDIVLHKQLRLEKYKLDFHKSPNNLMGSFDLVKHNSRMVYNKKTDNTKGESNVQSDDDRIVFEILVESSWLMQRVILHLEFGTLDSDDLKDGYLLEYSIRTLDDNILFRAKRDEGGHKDFSSVKQSLLFFLYSQYAISRWQAEAEYRNASGITPIGQDKEADAYYEAYDKTYDALGGNALRYLFEWQTSHCKYHWKDGQSGSAMPILKQISEYDSFSMNSPMLGVYCYYPCLWELRELKKADIRQEISKRIKSHKESISALEQKAVDMLLDSFEKSDSDYLHEYLSQKEDEKFFNKDIPHFGGGLAFPNFAWDFRSCDEFIDESNLPEEVDWSVVIYAMDVINKVVCGCSKSLIGYNELDCRYYHIMEDNINDFLRSCIEDLFVKMIPGSISYYSTTVVEPHRSYSLEDNNDLSRTLKNYFESKKYWLENKDRHTYNFIKNTKEEDYKPCSFINRWVKKLEIAHHVDIKANETGLVTIHLCRDRNDKKGVLLTELGLGVCQLFTVLLKIEIAILKMETNTVLYEYNNTGLSKDLMSLLRPYNVLKPVTVALEEPECHLHPSLQSKFADMIVEAFKLYGVHFLIESHSEYFIRKLQLLVSGKNISNNDVSLLYVNSASRPEHIPAITDIGLDSDGKLKNEFGAGFFDESERLSRKLYHRQ
jgi:predicted ATPase